MNPAVAWLRRFASVLPTKTVADQVLSEHIACYVSGGVVALAHGDFKEGLDVTLRADPLRHLTEIRDIVDAQISSLGLSRSPARKQASLVLAPEMYHVSLIDRPDVADDEVNEAVRWLIQDQVDYPMENATLDVFELPRSASRERPMVFVVSAQTELLRSLIGELQAAGLGVSSIDATELAMRNLVWQCFPHADQNIAMLRLTGNSGLINVSRADELYLARRISGVPDDFSEPKWEDFRERMLLQIQRSIDYYESAMNQPHCNMLVVACTDDWTARVTDYLREMLPIPVRSVDEILAEELQLTLHNPDRLTLDWTRLDSDTLNAVAAGLPAIGGVLRNQIARALGEVA